MVNNYSNITWFRIGPTLCKPMNCSLPGSSVHGILQADYWNGLPCTPLGLQGIFQTRGSSPCLLGLLQVLYHWHHLGSPE